MQKSTTDTCTQQRLLPLALTAAMLCAPLAQAAVTLKIINQNANKNVWLMWTDTAALGGGSNGIAIKRSESDSNAAGYRLTDFKKVAPDTYQIDNYTVAGGRLWFTFDSNWTFANPGYRPNHVNFMDRNFLKRYDKVEAYIMGGTNDNLDLTAMDAFSIPFSVKAYSSVSPAATTQILKGSKGTDVVAALKKIAAWSNGPQPVTPPGATPALQHIDSNSPYLIINSNSLGKTTSGSYKNSPVGSNGSFVRVIANKDRINPADQDPVALANAFKSGTFLQLRAPANYGWGNLENYVKHMDGRSSTPWIGSTTIAGQYVGTDPMATALTAPASYHLNATFDARETLTQEYDLPNETPHKNKVTFTGIVTLKGTANLTGPQFKGSYNVVIKLPYGGMPQYITPLPSGQLLGDFMLNSGGIIGANANYLYKFYPVNQAEPAQYSTTNPVSGGPKNDVLSWITGDLLSGMNLGTVGSDKTFASPIKLKNRTYAANQKVGTFESQDWFVMGDVLRGNNHTQSVYQYYFSFLQDPKSDFYNKYAAAIYPLTDAYGFAYSDRILNGKAAIMWNAKGSNPIDTIEITILAD